MQVTKPCDVTGCGGTMAFDDTEWPSYGILVCDRDSSHCWLLNGDETPSVKACTFAGCRGVMTDELHLLHFGPGHSFVWSCDVNSDHEEFELAGKIYRREDLLRLRADGSLPPTEPTQPPTPLTHVDVFDGSTDSEPTRTNHGVIEKTQQNLIGHNQAGVIH